MTRNSHLVRCYWPEATHHCPKVDAQKRPEHSKIRKYRQRAGSLQIRHRHTLLVGHKWWLRGIIWVCTLFFRKILLIPLKWHPLLENANPKWKQWQKWPCWNHLREKNLKTLRKLHPLRSSLNSTSSVTSPSANFSHQLQHKSHKGCR